MHFWELERHPAEATALIDARERWSYGALAQEVAAWSSELPIEQRTFGFLAMPNSAAAISLYLSCLRSGMHAPLLMQPEMDAALLGKLAAHYRPDWIALPSDIPPPEGFCLRIERGGMSLHWARSGLDNGKESHPELAQLLSTSGSTGSSKLVRLSYRGLASNAAAIAEYLQLRHDDRAMTMLPLAYSFGMSILNSHLHVGASIVLNDDSPVNRGFWDTAREHDITSLSGVPSTFEMLRRIRIEQLGLKRLRMLTQAGGRLRNELVELFAHTSKQLGADFYVMYGQTEAGPRISYVPPERILEKTGSIGLPIPGGSLTLHPETGELIYRGDNVMLGYAENREDLARGDDMQGVLHTGDLGRVDQDGYIYLTGRAKRFVKLSGSRVNLDEVEAMLASELDLPVACAGEDDALTVFIPGTECIEPARVKTLLQERYRIFHGLVRVCAPATLPTLPSGKIDYRALTALAGKE